MHLRQIVSGVASLAFVLAGTALPAYGCSECLCGSPTPPGYLLGEYARGLSYGLEDRYLSKANALAEGPGDERQVEHRIAGFLVYRPAPRAALQLRLPYVFKTNTQRPAGEPEQIAHGRGIGDAEALARLDVWRFGNLFSRRGALALIAAGAAPTGSNEARDAAGERLDAHLQPGTGAWAGTLGLATDASFLSAAVSASIVGRLNGTSRHGYHYGDAVLFNLGCARTLGPRWQAALELNGRSAGRDRTEDGSRDPNSGGSLLYAAPGLRWSGPGGIGLDLLVQIPVARSLNGVQSERTTGRLALVLGAR
jgi:hypothetical protein